MPGTPKVIGSPSKVKTKITITRIDTSPQLLRMTLNSAPNDKVLVLAKSEMELVCPIELGKTELEGSNDDVGYNRPPHRDTLPSYNHQPDVSVPITVEETLPAKSDGRMRKLQGRRNPE